MTKLLDTVRSIGITMGTRYERYYVGWTVDEAKARAAERAGAKIRHVPSRDKRFSGWEVIVQRHGTWET